MIFDYAENKRPSDMRKLLTRLLDAELFAPVVSGLPVLASGTKYVVKSEDSLQLRTVEISGLKLAIFHTDKNDKRLGGEFISMSGREAFEMIVKSGADGLAVQNALTSWFGLDRSGVLNALK